MRTTTQVEGMGQTRCDRSFGTSEYAVWALWREVWICDHCVEHTAWIEALACFVSSLCTVGAVASFCDITALMN